MKEPWDTGIALSCVESSCLRMKKLTADGSMLKGYTAKKLEDIDQEEVIRELAKMEKNVAMLKSYILA